jgi:transcriptional regulator with XRE-family HTH domain
MAKAVAELCQEHELTFDDFVKRCGLDDGRVRAIMLGRWTPSPAERKKIADVFNLSIDEIVWGHKTPIQHIYGLGPGG